MPSVSIHIRSGSGPDFETSDAGTVAAIRAACPNPDADSWLVPAHDLAGVLSAAGRSMWAAALERMEEPHVVRVKFTH